MAAERHWFEHGPLTDLYVTRDEMADQYGPKWRDFDHFVLESARADGPRSFAKPDVSAAVRENAAANARSVPASHIRPGDRITVGATSGWQVHHVEHRPDGGVVLTMTSGTGDGPGSVVEIVDGQQRIRSADGRDLGQLSQTGGTVRRRVDITDPTVVREQIGDAFPRAQFTAVGHDASDDQLFEDTAYGTHGYWRDQIVKVTPRFVAHHGLDEIVVRWNPNTYLDDLVGRGHRRH